MVFAVALFLLKTTSVFENKETYKGAGQKNGLTYGNITIKDLVNKDINTTWRELRDVDKEMGTDDDLNLSLDEFSKKISRYSHNRQTTSRENEH